MQKTIVIKASSDIARKLCSQIVEQINPDYFSQKDIFNIKLAIEEAMNNAVEHGSRKDSQKQITVDYIITTEIFEISVTDDGEGFQPDMVPDPREGENIRRVTGRGIVLMKALMDSVEYNERGNSVHTFKRSTGLSTNGH